MFSSAPWNEKYGGANAAYCCDDGNAGRTDLCNSVRFWFRGMGNLCCTNEMLVVSLWLVAKLFAGGDEAKVMTCTSDTSLFVVAWL